MKREGLIPRSDEPFFTLRIKYPEHERIVALERAEPKWLHTVALAQCNGHLTDGHIDPFRLKVIVAIADIPRPNVWIKRLVEAALWVELGDGHYAIRDYLDYNPSSASVKALRESRRAAGRLGGQAKAEANAVASATPSATTDGGSKSLADKKLEVEVEKEQDPKTIARMGNVQLVADAWWTHAPPLIGHRDSYLTSTKTRSAVEGALCTYPVEDVVEAVANYAEVLGGPEYRWDHSWTLIDFLKRGLDKFVPEAKPLDNFRIKANRNGGPNMKYGRRDVSAAEMLALADRLEATERKSLAAG